MLRWIKDGYVHHPPVNTEGQWIAHLVPKLSLRSWAVKLLLTILYIMPRPRKVERLHSVSSNSNPIFEEPSARTAIQETRAARFRVYIQHVLQCIRTCIFTRNLVFRKGLALAVIMSDGFHGCQLAGGFVHEDWNTCDGNCILTLQIHVFHIPS